MARVEVRSRVVGAPPGAGLGSVFFEASTTRMSVRELLHRAVEEQVRDLVARRRLSAEQALRELARQYQTPEEILAMRSDGGRAAAPRRPRPVPDVDVAAAQHRAVAAFEEGRCLVIVEGRQVERLDEEVAIGPATKVEFLRLLPLRGG